MRWDETDGGKSKVKYAINDENTKVIDLSNKRITEMRSNQRARLAKPM